MYHEFLHYFETENTVNIKKNCTYTDIDELDDLWAAYSGIVQDIKSSGNLVLRDKNGNHKIVNMSKCL